MPPNNLRLSYEEKIFVGLRNPLLKIGALTPVMATPDVIPVPSMCRACVCQYLTCQRLGAP